MSVEPDISAQSQLSNRNKIANNLNRAFQSSDIDAICQAIGVATRQYNITDIAKQSGLKRVSIYRAFGGHQHPNLTTVVRVLAAIGLQLKVISRRGSAGLARARVPNPASQRPD